jgi:hypothetical protein
MRDAASFPGGLRLLLEDQHIARARRLELREPILAVDLDGAKHLTIESGRAIDIAPPAPRA